ncbi:MAG: chemotaxis protein CheW [Syntrophomonadaceae bacterium]|nr:chemotaxis protein CheW [Syntrophomonadaceae bacterium]
MGSKDELKIDLLDDEYEEEDSLEDKYLTFVLKDEEYGIEIRYVTEIIGMQNITEVPDVNSFVKGVINLRGKVIPVIDIRLRFHLEERAYDNRTCVVVINIDEQVVGVIVDRVSEVITIPRGEVEPPPRIMGGQSSQFIQGMGKVGERVKMLLDANKLIFIEEV